MTITISISYLVLSAIMSICLTGLTVYGTDIKDFKIWSKISFVFYFFVANLLAWPVYCMFIACYILYDFKN